MADIFGALQSGWNMGQQMGEQKRKSALADLLGKAATSQGPQRQQYVAQAYGEDPGVAMQAERAFGQQEDERAERLRERARMLVALPPQMRPQAYASIVPELQQMGLGEGIPPQWSDDLLPTVEAIATSGQSQNVPAGFDAAHRTLVAAGFQPGTPEYARGMRIEAGLEPGFGKSAPRSMTVDINGVPTQVTFDPTTQRYIPATLGGAPQGGPVGATPQQGGDPFGFLAQAGATVTSGYRSKADNERVDGVPNSYHLTGQARDIVPPTDPQQAAFIRQQAAANGLEVIDEGDHWHLEPRPQGGVPIVGRPKEVEAYAEELAKGQAGLQLAPAQAAAKAEETRAVETAKADVKRDAAAPKRTAKARFEIDRASRVESAIDRALGQADWNATGLVGGALSSIPGTDAYNLARTVDEIKANIGFREIQTMRDNSPTGGALGQVAIQELQMLQATLGSLDQAQDGDQLRATLQRIKESMARWRQLQEAIASEGGQEPAPSGGWSIRVKGAN